MKKTWTSAPLLLAVFLFSNCLEKPSPEPAEQVGENKTLPSDWMYSQRTYPHHTIDQQAYRAAFRQMKKFWENPTNRNAGSWEQAGPTNTGGRITDIAMHPTDPATLYVGTSNGGLWKSTDTGANWAPVFEQVGASSIGDVAIAPSAPNTLYVGTGEANGAFESGAFYGDGVFKSTDGGGTWQHVGLEKTNHIGRIAVDPANADRVYVAAAGALYGTNPERGLYRTLNGGQSWEKVLFLTDSTACIDVVVNPQNADIVYAATWERIRRPWARSYGGNTSRIYRSLDGGNNWQQLTSGLPADNPERGRIGLAISPADPNVLYASFTINKITNTFDGLYKSTNSGSTWSLVGGTQLQDVFATFGWFFGNIRVHPTDPDDLFCLGVPLLRSPDGGNNWADATANMHVDFHALEYHPMDPNFIAAGNDGGLYLSQDGGNSWQHVDNIPNNLIYNAEIDFAQPERLYCGLQDQGTNRTLTGNLDDYERILGGDGFHVIVDPTDNNYLYCEYQFGVLFRSANGGADLEYLFNVDADADNRTNWNTPVVMDPTDPQTLYYGANRLWQTKNRGINWQPISPDLTDGQHPSGSSTYGTITTIGVAPSDPNVIYTGTDDGNVQVTFNEGGNWENISAGLPDRFVTKIEVHPTDPNTAYATFSGFRYIDYQPHILVTHNGGDTWTDVSNNLPEIPINDVEMDPEQPEVLYLANDLSVWHSVNSGETWEVLGDNFPATVVNDLVLHKPSSTLVAGTYGRSMLTYDVTGISPAGGTGPGPVFAQAKMDVWPNPVGGATLVLFDLPMAAEGRVQVFNVKGHLVQTLANQRFTMGKNEVAWDAGGLAAGVYFVVLQIGENSLVCKVVR